MKLSVVIPTRGDQNMQNIIDCLQKQTFKDFEVIFIIDKNLKNTGNIGKTGGNDVLSDFLSDFSEERIGAKLMLNIRFITDINSPFFVMNNASALRNLGIKAAKGEFIQLMDDDEWFEENYFEQSLLFRENYYAKLNKDFVLTPTLMYRKTGQIQNQGFSSFNYRLSRPTPQRLGEKKRDYIQMYSGNSLLAPAHIFKEVLFDERLDFVYEDLDFSYRIHRAGYPLIVLRALRIYHMERDKTQLEHAWVANEYSAYRKAKHRMIFVKKYGTVFQKMQFYLLGFWGQPLWLIIKILFYAPRKEKWKLIRAIWKGTFV